MNHLRFDLCPAFPTHPVKVPMRLAVLLYLLLLLFPTCSDAQTVQLKDGKVFYGREIRRDGNFLFVKAAKPDGSVTDELVQIPQLERIEFPEVPALAEARQRAQTGDAAGVIESTTEAANFFRTYADLPGSPWSEIMRLRLPALAVAGTAELLADLQKNWAPTGDAELDTAFRLMTAARNDVSSVQTAWKALAQPGAGSLAAGISFLELGKAALEAKQWREALSAFLSVEVFVPQHRVLLPSALLGATKAFLGKADRAKASAYSRELTSDFPGTPEAAAAAELLK
jgi:hypothetical protein